MSSPRTTLEYVLMVDYISSHGRGTKRIFLGEVQEDEALSRVREELDHTAVHRVEVFVRDVPVDWRKVEELTRRDV